MILNQLFDLLNLFAIGLNYNFQVQINRFILLEFFILLKPLLINIYLI